MILNPETAQLFGDYKGIGSKLEKIVRDPYYG